MEDEKVLCGAVCREDKDAKLICESVQTFDEIPKSSGLNFRRWKPISSRKKAASAIAASDGRIPW
ncbi:MAG: hypothetical protein ACLURV_06660 [Gallintestinimicrobium sp.]